MLSRLLTPAAFLVALPDLFFCLSARPDPTTLAAVENLYDLHIKDHPQVGSSALLLLL